MRSAKTPSPTGRTIAEVTQFCRADAGKNARFPDRIAERFQPLIELGGAKKAAHSRMYPYGYLASMAEFAFASRTPTVQLQANEIKRAKRASQGSLDSCNVLLDGPTPDAAPRERD